MEKKHIPLEKVLSSTETVTVDDETITNSTKLTLFKNKKFCYVYSTNTYDSFDGDTTVKVFKATGAWKENEDKTIVLKGKSTYTVSNYKNSYDDSGSTYESPEKPFKKKVTNEELSKLT